MLFLARIKSVVPDTGRIVPSIRHFAGCDHPLRCKDAQASAAVIALRHKCRVQARLGRKAWSPCPHGALRSEHPGASCGYCDRPERCGTPGAGMPALTASFSAPQPSPAGHPAGQRQAGAGAEHPAPCDRHLCGCDIRKSGSFSQAGRARCLPPNTDCQLWISSSTISSTSWTSSVAARKVSRADGDRNGRCGGTR